MEKKTRAGKGFYAYVKYVWKEKKSIYLMGLFFFPAYILANFLQIYLPKMVVMELEEERSILYLGITTLGLVLLLMVSIFIRAKMMTGIEYRNQLLEQKMQNSYIKKLLYIDYKYLEDKEFLSVRNKVKESLFGEEIGDEKERAQIVDFMKTLLTAVAVSGNLLLYIYYLCKLSPWLLIILIITPLAMLLINKTVTRNEDKYAVGASDAWQKINYITRRTEDFTMAKDVRLYQMNGWLMGLLDKYYKKRLFYKGKELKTAFFAVVVSEIAFAMYLICYFACVLYRLWEGDIAVSDVIFFAGMGPAMYNLLDLELLIDIKKLSRISTRFARFKAYMDYGEDTGNKDVPVKHEAASLVLEDVTFSYPDAKEEVIKHLNLSVRKGEKVAIVGVNGAGKTTLMKLICGLLHPTSGRILLNGRDMEEMEAEERYAAFSCAFQDIQFLPLSIRENISMNHIDDTDDGRVWRCIDQAGMKDAIKSLPSELKTRMEKNIHEDAVDFSGGQKQKLILARALYRDAGVLILDEPTAALDALAENDIYERYAQFAKDKTSFFVSHRLSSTRFCDRILLIDGGKVAEEGTHEELLAAEGLYAKMFALQSKYYQEGRQEA